MSENFDISLDFRKSRPLCITTSSNDSIFIMAELAPAAIDFAMQRIRILLKVETLGDGTGGRVMENIQQNVGRYRCLKCRRDTEKETAGSPTKFYTVVGVPCGVNFVG